MSQTILLKRSAVDNKEPITTDLALGEVAINTYNGRLFIKKDDGVEAIVEFAPIDSPNFIGIPSGPTAAVDTDTSQLATTSYVISQGYLKSSVADLNYQPLNGDLTAIVGISGTSGILTKTGANTWSLDTTDYSNASNLTSGTVNSARLGTGTADNTTYLRGDGTWQVVTSGSGATISDENNNANTLYPTFATSTVTSSGTLTDVIVASTKLTFVPNTGLLSTTSLYTSGDATISGDLTVNGTTTTINATTLVVNDKNIEMGSVTTPDDTTANGGGITLKGATDKTIIWDNTNDNWTSSENWNIQTGKVFKINNVNVLSDTTLGSSVVNSSLTSVGTLTSLTTSGNITITGGNRILGDFSNATPSNRLTFQTSSPNNFTTVGAIPTGSGTVASFASFSSSDASNASFLNVGVESGDVGFITSGKTGTGSYLPLIFHVNAAERFRIGTSGELGVGFPSDYGTSGQVLTSGGTGSAPTWTTLSISNSLDELTDVVISSAANNQLLSFNGTNWVNTTPTFAATSHTHSAADITSGTIDTARLGTGTADSTTYLRGDNTWATVAGGGATLSAASASTTYYLPMSSTTTGTWSDARVDNTNLYYTTASNTLFCNNYNTTSDINYKFNINKINNGLDTIKKLQGVGFNWKDTGLKSYGVIAQELEQIIPDLVSTDDNGKKSVNYLGIIGFLIEAVKELSDKVEGV